MLKRHAFLLCGDDAQAEDLVQDALMRAFARPLRTPRPGGAEAYVRVIMVNLFINGVRRRTRWRRAVPLLARAEVACDPADQVASHDALLVALHELSPGSVRVWCCATTKISRWPRSRRHWAWERERSSDT